MSIYHHRQKKQTFKLKHSPAAHHAILTLRVGLTKHFYNNIYSLWFTTHNISCDGANVVFVRFRQLTACYPVTYEKPSKYSPNINCNVTPRHHDRTPPTCVMFLRVFSGCLSACQDEITATQHNRLDAASCVS